MATVAENLTTAQETLAAALAALSQCDDPNRALALCRTIECLRKEIAAQDEPFEIIEQGLP